MGNAVEFVKINKSFPGVHVLKDISFSVKEGEIHALIGENGAGKSTLLNILHGVYGDYEGDVLLHGKKVSFKNANDAIKNGNISKVHQEIMVVEELTVGQNVTMGYEPKKGPFIDFTKMHNDVDEILEELNCNFRSRDIVRTLTAGQKQMIAIAKAIYHHSNIISFDEPTAALTSKETEALFAVIRKLKKDGITILFVSHHLDELFELCDRASVFRDGEFVTTLTMAESNEDELIHAMVGRSVSSVASRLAPSRATDEVVLKVDGLTDITHNKFKDVSFELHKGEILGFYGLVGAGRTEVMRVLVGADPKLQGDIYLKNIKIPTNWNSTKALSRGIGMLSEDRKTTGFNKLATNIQNIAISSLEKYMTAGFFTNDAKKRKNAEHFFEELDINPKIPDYMTVNMSGGNQQKVILAKWMSTDIDIIIFDEPTKGVDVAAKAEIYRLMEELVAEGKSLIVVSSELPEAMGLSDRLIVMSEGRITKVLENREEFDQDAILNYAIGGDE
ncbi:MAG: sugar ABC transporter ATP-binding protein [Eubacteriales bacterium]|nr:sugar ABC transporter ATP-binding protein [Eubacteriales bacterium]